MTVGELLAELRNAKPGFVPFQPYVCGMPTVDVPTGHDDPMLRAAIHVYFGDQKGAHDQFQPLEGMPEASYLHGIIHRREGDFWNANYWFRQARSIARQIGINPEDLTERVQASPDPDNLLADDLLAEWKSLVDLRLRQLG
ncbi:MAG: hypothetical protein JST51_16440 [Armatimonadetes bacterium]|nr:hypothetical protein [Armatimonadota bacterium]